MENNFQPIKWVLIVLFGICSISAYAQTPDTDLTTHEPTTVPSGATFEWREGATSSSPLVGTPTAVQPGLYYGYYNFGAGCFSEGAPIRIITNICPTTTVDLNSAVDAPTGTESFHSGLPVSDANEITGTAITEATPSTYYVAFKTTVDGASCYSAANPIVVVETACSGPIAQDDINTTLVDLPVSGNVLTNDQDPDGDPLTASSTPLTPPVNGSVVLNPDGSYTYTPDPSFVGEDAFVYEVCDPFGNCDTATATIEVLPVPTPDNDSPIANNDATSTPTDTPVDIAVLANDFDPDGDPLGDPTILTPPANGTVVVNPDGTITYTPDPGFEGDDPFTYETCDPSGACDTAEVIVTITPSVFATNDPPTAIDDAEFTEVNTPVSATVASNDSDPNGGDVLTWTQISNPVNGSVSFNPDGSYTYTPNAGYVGSDQFTYFVCDNGTPELCDTATAYITIADPNEKPFAQDDINNTLVNTPVDGNVLTNDEDPDGDPLVVTTTPITDPSNGSVVLNPDGTYTYTPDPGFLGEDEFIYEVCDPSGACDQATAVIDVVPVPGPANDAPVANNDATETPTDTPVDIAVLANDFDPDGDPLSNPTILTPPSNGTVVVNPDGTLSYTPDPGFEGEDVLTYETCDGNGACDEAEVIITVSPSPFATNDPPTAIDDAELTEVNTPVSATVASNDSDPNGGDVLTWTQISNPVNGSVSFNPDGSYTYTPNAGYVGSDQFTYFVCDNGTPVLCDTATAYITIADPNEKPFAQDDINNTLVNTPVDGNVLTNDEDPDGDPLVVTTTPITDPSNGSVVLNPDGTYTYTPDPGFLGEDEFVYEVCDPSGACDQATAVIDVVPVPGPANDAPIANNDATETPTDTPVDIAVLANDFDPDGDPLSNPTILTPPSNGTVVVNPDGTLSYTPDPGFEGEDVLTYETCDGNGACDEAEVIITVSPSPFATNDPPTAIDDAELTEVNTPVSATVASNDSDPNGGDVLTWTQISNPVNGSVSFNPDGSYTYTPNAGYVGSDQFTYFVCDNGTPVLCDTATAYITIADPNEKPFAQDDINNTLVNTPVDGNVLTNDEDPDGDPLVVTTTPITDPSNGSVVLNPDGTYTYTPDPGFLGEDEFVYEVCDPSGACDQATAVIDVVPVPGPANDAPVANNDATETPTDTPVDIAVLANDFDPDGDPLSNPTILTPPSNGTVVVNPDGTLSYTPDPGFEGEDVLTYETCDGNGACDEAEVIITVSPSPFATNDPPTAIDDAELTEVNTPVSATVASNDSDPNGGDVLTWTQISNPVNGSVSFNPDGSYTYTPNAGYVGSDQFTYFVCDNGTPVLCDTATAYITIADPNEKPFAQDDINNTLVNTPVNGNVLTNDEDSDGDVLLASTTPITPPANGSVILNPDGSYTYTPNPGFVGKDQFVYEACDPSGACDTATAVIDVIPVPTPANDAPVANNDATETPPATPVDIPVLANDIDPDGDPLSSPTILTPPANGTVVVNPDGSITYTPNPGFEGEDVLTYETCDPGGLCDQAEVIITVAPSPVATNDPPTAIDDAELTQVNTAISATVASNDSDPNPGDVLTWTQISNPANGSVSFNPDGSYTYTPNAGFVGNDQFTYFVCDNGSPVLCDTATAYITIADPGCTADAGSLTLDCAVAEYCITDHDVDVSATPDGNIVVPTGYSVVYVLTRGPNLVIRQTSTTPMFTIIHPDDYIIHTLVYDADPNSPDYLDLSVIVPGVTRASDVLHLINNNGLCADLDVAGAPLEVLYCYRPMAIDDFVNTLSGHPVSGDVKVNDQNPMGNPISITRISGPFYGSVVFNPDGTYTYTPDPYFVGEDEFTYENCDDTYCSPLCDVSTVFIEVMDPDPTINHPPIANPDVSCAEGTTPITLHVLCNDLEPDGDSIMGPFAISPPSYGSVVYNADGTITYTPNGTHVGTDVFSYAICDNATPALCDTTIVTIYTKVDNNKKDPPHPIDDAMIVGVNGIANRNAGQNDIEWDGDVVSYSLVSSPQHGSLSNFNPATGTYTYSPDFGYVGPDQFVYMASDVDGSNNATVSITVNGPANPFPVEWLDFSAKQVERDGWLNWSTGSERNASHFEVERSLDGMSFGRIGEVAATGNSTSVQNYQFTDENILAWGVDHFYYRLRQVDVDGSFTYSKTVQLTLSGNFAIAMEVYPSPATDRLQIDWSSASPVYRIEVVNSLGQTVYNQKLTDTALEGSHQLEVDQWSRGVYYVQLYASGKVQMKRFQVE